MSNGLLLAVIAVLATGLMRAGVEPWIEGRGTRRTRRLQADVELLRALPEDMVESDSGQALRARIASQLETMVGTREQPIPVDLDGDEFWPWINTMFPVGITVGLVAGGLTAAFGGSEALVGRIGPGAALGSVALLGIIDLCRVVVLDYRRLRTMREDSALLEARKLSND